MSPDVSPDSVEQSTSTVAALRTALTPFGYAAVLDALPDDADEREIMGRLVEMGADLSSPKGAEGKLHPTPKELMAFVVASTFLKDTSHRDVLLGRVRIHTYSDDKEEAIMAHRALAHVDPVSAAIVLHHEHQAMEQRRKATQAGAMRIVA